MPNKHRWMRVIKYTLSALWWCVLGTLLVLVITIVGAKMRGEVPRVFGYSIVRIVSGSMEPDIPKDSFILIRTCAPEEVQLGDIITFYSDDPKIRGLLNTHRVCDEPYMGEQGLLFPTKGTATLAPDPVPARADALVGVYVTTLGDLTAFNAFLSRGPAMPILLGGLMVGIVVMFFMTVKASQGGTDTKQAKEDAHEDDKTC